MEDIPYSHIDKGTFMIATPEIDAGIFFRGVILICEHNPSGSFGLVINKPLNIEVPEEIFHKEDQRNPRVGLRAGGPVQTNQMMLLHTSPSIPSQTLEITDNLYLGGDLNFLHDTISDPEGGPVLLCFGYTGWGGGQLEQEFLDGGWYLFPADKKYIFDVDPEKLWQTLLREMGGKYASLAMIPDDLTLN